jgi:hypothetical protein
LACLVLIRFDLVHGSSKMSVQEEQERRSELLLRAFESYSDPEQALAMALRMEQFIIGDQTSHEKPQEVAKLEVHPPADEPRKAPVVATVIPYSSARRQVATPRVADASPPPAQ